MSRRLIDRALRPTTFICSQCRRRQAPTTAVRHVSTSQPRHAANLLDTLESRGLINQLAGDRGLLHNALSKRKLAFYAGIDPTAPSLHLGHLLPLMVLFWTAVHGHNAVSLVGGATARVGDPSGRLTSRESTGEDVQKANFDAMFAQVRGLWETAMGYARRRGFGAEEGSYKVVDNAQWLDKLNVLEFLRLLGNGMRVGTMLGRDTVRNKMEKGDGMSFSEFSYPLLQGWDWWHMYRTMDVQVQIGGSDQYGNIVAGIDAVKHIAQSTLDHSETRPQWLDGEGRLRDASAPMGLTVPLLTTSGGEKFGKSAGNAVWLDRRLTSPFDLYGFLLRSADADVERYLKLFTLTPIDAIDAVMRSHEKDPGKREAQHLLAFEVLMLVHGEEVAIHTQREHRAMRNPSMLSPKSSTNESSGEGGSNAVLSKADVIGQVWPRVLQAAGIAVSKSEGTRMVSSGAVYVASGSEGAGGELQFTQVKDPKSTLSEDLLVAGTLLVRIGKWKVRIIEIADDK